VHASRGGGYSLAVCLFSRAWPGARFLIYLLPVMGRPPALAFNAVRLSSFACGTFEHLKDEQENNIKLMEIIKSIYKQYTKFPMKELDAILKRDLWLDAATCLKYGLVDEII
jgi:ATP-dependent protease ClpP protease subunit